MFERDREHFVAARSFLRLILAHYVGCGPRDLQFGYGLHGKPQLQGVAGSEPIAFNLSHTRGKAICAVALGRQVGVDIEQIRPEVDILGIARTTFSSDEYARLTALPPGQHLAAFYACWTRKEAYIKALGAGLSYPLDAFDVSFEPNTPAQLLRSADGEAERQRWVLRELEAGDGYAAAVVVEQPLTSVRTLEFC
jgi:4'-phosphopantetheinyl transferase